MTPTDAQTEAVEGAIHRYLAEMSNEEIKWRGFSTLGHLLNEIEVEKLARATISGLSAFLTAVIGPRPEGENDE